MVSLKEDIEEFMGIPYDEVVKGVVDSKDDTEYRRQLWNGMFQKEVTKENIWDYYRSEQYSSYIFWQAVQMQDKPAMPQVLANVLSSSDRVYVQNHELIITERRILDYRCGNGMIDLGLRNMGFVDITLADIPHRYNKFLKFISDKYRLGFKFVPIEAWNEYPLDRKYDVIICNEVLEHVWEPELTLLHLAEHLEQFGYIYISAFFNDTNMPSHLEKNSIYQDAEKWSRIVESMGLKKTFHDENGAWKIWQKT